MYPDHAAENLAGVTNDPDPHLQITAAQAIGESIVCTIARKTRR
jgi:hypothetical protein